MNILFVFTGGTIGSTLNRNNIIAADTQKSYAIIDTYSKKYALDFDYDIVEPYIELSENNTGDHIRMLAECVGARLGAGYDGIIVTHGTDTLQYSAAALGYLAGADSVPICLVSSNKPIEDEQSNALYNLHSAICFIKNREGRGVFVLYRNSNSNVVRVHRGTRLIGTKAFSDDVSSIFGGVYGHFDADFNFVKNEEYQEKEDESATFDLSTLCESNEEILMIFPHPGMVYPKLGEKVKYILHNTYHSGTVNTRSESTKEFFLDAKARGIKTYIVGVTDGLEYESSGIFGELGLIPLKNLSPVAAYVKLWILSGSRLSDSEITEKLMQSLSGDIAP